MTNLKISISFAKSLIGGTTHQKNDIMRRHTLNGHLHPNAKSLEAYLIIFVNLRLSLVSN
jgi:hypothetical protein